MSGVPFQWDGTSLDTDLDKEGAATTLRTSMTLPVELLSEVALLGRLKAEGPGNQTSAAQACPGPSRPLKDNSEQELDELTTVYIPVRYVHQCGPFPQFRRRRQVNP